MEQNIDTKQLRTIAKLCGAETIDVMSYYIKQRNEWTETCGSCLDAPDYDVHWNNREAYALRRTQEYYIGLEDEVLE